MSTESLRLREQVVRTALERLHAPTMPDWENADRDFEQAIAAFDAAEGRSAKELVLEYQGEVRARAPEPTPEHPIGVEIRNAAASKLARLRERDFALTQVLTRGLHAALVQGKRASVRLDWTVKAMKDALALLKEEP